MYGRHREPDLNERPTATARRGNDRGRDALISSTALSDWLYRIPALAVGAGLIGVGTAHANPEDPTVVSGSVDFINTSDTRLDIIQNTNTAIVNFRSFSIDIDEHTNIAQPSAFFLAPYGIGIRYERAS